MAIIMSVVNASAKALSSVGQGAEQILTFFCYLVGALFFSGTFFYSGVVWSMSTGQTVSEGLTFQGGSTFKVVPPNSELYAQHHRVGGRNASQWMVARVENGNQLVNNTLVFESLSGGTDSLVGREGSAWMSPPLPTHTTGLYIVKLAGAANRRLVQIHYQVSGQLSSQLAAPQTISLVTPRPSEKVSRQYQFQWVAEDGASFYRYELYVSRFVPFFGRGDGEPGEENDKSDLSTVYQYGRLLSGRIRALSLVNMNTPTLRHDSSVYWRVVGLDVAGNTISVSPLQRVQIYR
jgi:hypothetical protein